MDGPEAIDDDRRCVKLKISRLLAPGKLLVLREAVAAIHVVVCKATLLIKRFYLTEQLGEDDAAFHIDIDFVLLCFNVVQGIRPAKRTSTRSTPEEREAKDLADDEWRTLMYRLEACFARQGARKAPRVVASVSHILVDSAETLITAMKNNVDAHYEDYMWRLGKAFALIEVGPGDARSRIEATTRLATYFLSGAPTAPSPRDVAVQTRLRVPRRAAATALAYDTKRRPWDYLRTMALATRELDALRKADAKRSKPHVLDSVRLYTPFSLVTSFIPAHIHIGTAAMVQLLGSVADVKLFKARYDVEHNEDLKVKNLSDVCKSFEKATGHAPATPEVGAMYFTRLWEAVCSFDTKKAFRSLIAGTERLAPGAPRRPAPGHPRGADDVDMWRFDNSIFTDGYSVSFCIVRSAALRKKDRFADRARKKKAKARAKAEGPPPPEFEVLSPVTAPSLSHLLDIERYKLVAVDPGKGAIVAVNDGAQVVAYTSAQRARDTRTAQHSYRANTVRLDEHDERPVVGTYLGHRRLWGGDDARQRNRRVRRRQRWTSDEQRVWTDPSVASYESAVLSGASSRAIDVDEFDDYVRRREAMHDAERACYERPVFRNQRFEAFSLRRSSEDKFVNRLVSTFCPLPSIEPPLPAAEVVSPSPPTMKKKERPHPWMAQRASEGDPVMRQIQASLEVATSRELILIYGNWGRAPNLRGSRPTPGIAFRRFLDRAFRTLMLWEAYTSQVCPCCQRRTLAEGELEGAQRQCTGKHHLLRCTIETCSRWWNRDAAASMNQLVKGVYLLQGGDDESGWFRSD